MSEATFLSERLERLERGNLSRRRRISIHAWNHAIQVLAERMQELEQQPESSSPEDSRIARERRNITASLKATLSDVRGRIQELIRQLEEAGKAPERNQGFRAEIGADGELALRRPVYSTGKYSESHNTGIDHNKARLQARLISLAAEIKALLIAEPHQMPA